MFRFLSHLSLGSPLGPRDGEYIIEFEEFLGVHRAMADVDKFSVNLAARRIVVAAEKKVQPGRFVFSAEAIKPLQCGANR